MQKLILVFLLLMGSLTVINAQRGDRETQGDRWWYGAHVNLGFSASTFESVLGLGVSPMAGYKVTPVLSVGPRAKLNYTYFRFRQFGGPETTGEGLVDYGLGAFVRANIYRGFFAQGEIGYENNGQLTYNGSDFFETRISGINAFIGAGYNSSSGGNVAYEVMLAYDLNLININTLDLLNYRVGFTVFY
jgi:hypothetical protein